MKHCDWWLGGSGLLSWWLYVVLVWLSRGFTYETPGSQRPLLPVFALFAALFALYLFQAAIVVRNQSAGRQLSVIVVFAVAFRMLLLFSEPIQEVDAYRYLWDGKACAAGVSPFRFSPEQVRNADSSDEHKPDLQRLIELRDRTAANATILSRVHFGQLTTVYPPVSQFVFTVAALLTPDSAAVRTHMLTIKLFIIAFDVATIWILVKLLQLVGRPPEWSFLYAWCPLVLKEFANSGHLDSIAVFLTTAAIYCAVRGFYGSHSQSGRNTERATSGAPRRWTLLAAFVLSLAVGSKIYPIILAPILFLSAWHRIGPKVAMSSGILTLTLAAAMVFPMLHRERVIAAADPTSDAAKTSGGSIPLEPPVPDIDSDSPEPLRPRPNVPAKLKIDENSTGLAAFASQWQMNNFLFLLVFENLKPTPSQTRSWFVVSSNRWRRQFVDSIATLTSLAPQQIPFLTTRLVTGTAFALLALWFAHRGRKLEASTEWLEQVFLTVAWFWLLLPTQNPWYWIWALPFVPFAQSRLWLAMSGLTLLYYTRFWFSYHMASTPVLGTPYVGAQFFDLVVTWIEFAPWFLWLAMSRFRRRRFPFPHPPRELCDGPQDLVARLDRPRDSAADLADADTAPIRNRNFPNP